MTQLLEQAAPKATDMTKGRWQIALAGVAIQMMLGTVYAWSIFKKSIMADHKWDSATVGTTFGLTIFFLGLSAAVGGRLVDRAGTRKVASIAAVLFGVGMLLAGVAHQTGSWLLLWLGYGVIAGIGNGLGYVTPVAVLLRWFPDKKGTITGLAVMGFGLGAAVMTKVGGWMIDAFGKGQGVYATFYVSGVIFLIGILVAARKLVNPPADYHVPTPSGKPKPVAVVSVSLRQASRMNQLYLLWGMLFLNVFAGIALISNLGYIGTDNKGLLKADAEMVVFLGSLFNGFGRVFWGTLSEKLGRRNVFLLIFLTQIPLFILLPQIQGFWAFAAVSCYILLCYGGGFGTMPSFTAETFGPKNIGSIYGMVLLAWGIAGGFGPGLMEFVNTLTQTPANPKGNFDLALYIAAGVLTLGLVLALLYRKPTVRPEALQADA